MLISKTQNHGNAMKLVFNPYLNYWLKYSFCDIQSTLRLNEGKLFFIIHFTNNYYEKNNSYSSFIYTLWKNMCI